VSRVLPFPSSPFDDATEELAEALRLEILAGSIRPGERFTKDTFFREHALPPHVLRAAISMLVSERLLNWDTNGGFSVAELSVEEVSELFELRRVIETAAVYATVAAQPGEFISMQSALASMRRAVETLDWRAIVEHDLTFHRLLVAFLGSERVGSFYWDLLSELRPSLTMLDRAIGAELEAMVRVHELFLVELIQGKLDAAANRLDRHFTETEKRLRIMLLMQNVPERRRASR
jgi:DNA-binding GntR family transcriptional regulator